MTIHSLDEVKDLTTLCGLLQDPSEAKIECGWFGRTVVIGDVKCSEKQLFDTLQQLVKPANDEETLKKIGLCAKGIIQLWDNEQECSLPKRLFQKIFFPVARFLGYKKAFDLRDLREIEKNSALVDWNGKSGKLISFVENFGETFPKLRQAYVNYPIRPTTPNEDKKNFLQSLIEDVPLGKIQQVFTKLTKESPCNNKDSLPPKIPQSEFKSFINSLKKTYLAKKIATECGAEKMSAPLNEILKKKEHFSAEEIENLKSVLTSENLKIKLLVNMRAYDAIYRTHITKELQRATIITKSVDVD